MPPELESALAVTAGTLLGVMTIIIAGAGLVAYLLSKNAPQPIRMMFLLISLLAVLTFIYAAYHQSLEYGPQARDPQPSGTTENAPQPRPQSDKGNEAGQIEDGPGGGAPSGEQPQ